MHDNGTRVNEKATYFFVKVKHPEWVRILGDSDEFRMTMAVAAYCSFSPGKSGTLQYLPRFEDWDNDRRKAVARRLRNRGILRNEGKGRASQISLGENSPISVGDTMRTESGKVEHYLKVWRTSYLYDMLDDEPDTLRVLCWAGWQSYKQLIKGKKASQECYRFRSMPGISRHRLDICVNRLREKNLIPGAKTPCGEDCPRFSTSLSQRKTFVSLCKSGVCSFFGPKKSRAISHQSIQNRPIKHRKETQEETPPPSPARKARSGRVSPPPREAAGDTEDLQALSPEEQLQAVHKELPILAKLPEDLKKAAENLYLLRVNQAKYPVNWGEERAGWATQRDPAYDKHLAHALEILYEQKTWKLDWTRLRKMVLALEGEEWQGSAEGQMAYWLSKGTWYMDNLLSATELQSACYAGDPKLPISENFKKSGYSVQEIPVIPTDSMIAGVLYVADKEGPESAEKFLQYLRAHVRVPLSNTVTQAVKLYARRKKSAHRLLRKYAQVAYREDLAESLLSPFARQAANV